MPAPTGRRRRRRLSSVSRRSNSSKRGDDVGDVEEAVAFETEVNEGRLHAGQHFRYPALVDVANHAARALALDEDLGNLIVLEDRDPCFVGARGDDHLLAHARNSERAVARALSGLPPARTSRYVSRTASSRVITTAVSVGRVLCIGPGR